VKLWHEMKCVPKEEEEEEKEDALGSRVVAVIR
jgi:hypothetical protein